MHMWKLILCLIVITVVLSGCGAEKLPEEEIPVSAQTLSRECAVYYDRGGLLIPVNVNVEWGKLNTALADAVCTAPEGSDLKSALPENAQISIYAEDDTALVDISGLPEDISKNEVGLMLDAVSATLLQFEGITGVKYTLNDAQTFSDADVSQPVSSVVLNPAYHIGDYTPFRVYYKTGDGLMLPVTKEAAELSPTVLVNAMIKEPTADELESLFPSGTLLNSAELTDGVLRLDFSPELYSVAATPGAEQLLMTGINLTCAQIEGVRDISITVDGSEYGSQYSYSETVKSVFSNVIP